MRIRPRPKHFALEIPVQNKDILAVKQTKHRENNTFIHDLHQFYLLLGNTENVENINLKVCLAAEEERRKLRA